MNRGAKNKAPQGAPGLPPRLLSSWLRLDSSTWTLMVKQLHSRESEQVGWHPISIGDAWLPPSAINAQPMRLRERPELCATIVAVIDAYLTRQKFSKSTHVVVADIARFLVKLFEYAWLQGFYRIQDMPEEAWDSLRESLVEGGWVKTLNIEERTALLLRHRQGSAALLLRPPHTPDAPQSVPTETLNALGTNVAARELRWVRSILLQAKADRALGRTGDFSRYHRIPHQQMSVSMLLQTLRSFNLLADINPPLGLTYLPTADVYAFAHRHGRTGKRTQNLSPQTGSALLKTAFQWVLEFGPPIVALVEAISVHLAEVYGPDFAGQYATDPNRVRNLTAIRSYHRTRLLSNLPEVKAVEVLIGRRITNSAKLTSRGTETSLYAVLNQLYAGCFVVLAAMNARRKDELSHNVIGLHENCLRSVDAELKLSQCEFYIEKTLKDYEWLYVNEVSQAAIRVLQAISSIAWSWREHVTGQREPVGRNKTLFCYPAFASSHKGQMLWFDFNANPGGMANEFLSVALGEQRCDFVVAPHMFRRLYGLIYHYRFEDATLIALAQKYFHLDITSVLHYVTNGAETDVGAHAATLWSAPARTVKSGRSEQESIRREVQAVGVEKLRIFVEDVLSGIPQFAGGFAVLVSRLHRRLSGHIDYSSLDKKKMAAKLSESLEARGHMPEPYKHATCMAGQNRRRAACSEDGRLARERAGPATCSACPYSMIVSAHIDAMEEDEGYLAQVAARKGSTFEVERAAIELENLRLVIKLNKRRIGQEQ